MERTSGCAHGVRLLVRVKVALDGSDAFGHHFHWREIAGECVGEVITVVSSLLIVVVVIGSSTS
jgi:hypothetical protein